MKIKSEYNVNMPTYALCYLINDDDSGIDETDKLKIDQFMDQFYKEADQDGGSVVIDTPEDDPFFTSRPAFGLPCDCLECKIIILV